MTALLLLAALPSASAVGNDAVVCVMNASGLLNEDTALFGVDTSDPFATLTFLTPDGEKKACKSETVSNTVSPRWSYCCPAPAGAKLTVRIFDEDTFDANDLLGETAAVDAAALVGDSATLRMTRPFCGTPMDGSAGWQTPGRGPEHVAM